MFLTTANVRRCWHTIWTWFSTDNEYFDDSEKNEIIAEWKKFAEKTHLRATIQGRFRHVDEELHFSVVVSQKYPHKF